MVFQVTRSLVFCSLSAQETSRLGLRALYSGGDSKGGMIMAMSMGWKMIKCSILAVPMQQPL